MWFQAVVLGKLLMRHRNSTLHLWNIYCYVFGFIFVFILRRWKAFFLYVCTYRTFTRYQGWSATVLFQSSSGYTVPYCSCVLLWRLTNIAIDGAETSSQAAAGQFGRVAGEYSARAALNYVASWWAPGAAAPATRATQAAATGVGQAMLALAFGHL